MKGMRYSPFHVPEFCGEMQGKFTVSLARLTSRPSIPTLLHVYKFGYCITDRSRLFMTSDDESTILAFSESSNLI